MINVYSFVANNILKGTNVNQNVNITIYQYLNLFEDSHHAIFLRSTSLIPRINESYIINTAENTTKGIST